MQAGRCTSLIHFVLQKGKRKLWMLGDIAQGEWRLIMINSNEAGNYSSETFWAWQVFFFFSFLTRRPSQVQTKPKVACSVLSYRWESVFVEKFALSNLTLSLVPHMFFLKLNSIGHSHPTPDIKHDVQKEVLVAPPKNLKNVPGKIWALSFSPGAFVNESTVSLAQPSSARLGPARPSVRSLPLAAGISEGWAVSTASA